MRVKSVVVVALFFGAILTGAIPAGAVVTAAAPSVAPLSEDVVQARVGLRGIRVTNPGPTDELAWLDSLALLEETGRDYPYLRAVGDLDGDGLSDTLTVGQTAVQPDATGDALDSLVVARRGFDGAELWHYTFDALPVTVAPISMGDGAGVLIVADAGTGSTGFGTNTGVQSVRDRILTLHALDGAGSVAWTLGPIEGTALRVFPTSGGEPAVNYFDNYVAFGGVMESGAGQASRILLNTLDRVETPAGIQSTTRVQLLNAGSGATVADRTLTTEGSRPVATASPDLDGDRVGDVVVLSPGTGPGAGVSTLSGADLATRWSNPDADVPVFADLRDTADTNGDGTTDLLIGGSNVAVYTTSGGIGPLWPFIVVDGAAGTQRLSTSASTGYALGDVNGDGRAEIGFQSIVREGTDVVVLYDAINSAGQQLFSEEYRMTLGGAGVDVSLYPRLGDVQPDGVADAGHRIQGATTLEQVVDGRTGAPLRNGPVGSPLAPLTAGAGSDTLTVTKPTNTSVVVELRDGLTGTLIWATAPINTGRNDDVASVTASVSDVDGDGTGDLLASILTGQTVQVQGGSSTELSTAGAVINGKTGAIRWQP